MAKWLKVDSPERCGCRNAGCYTCDHPEIKKYLYCCSAEFPADCPLDDVAQGCDHLSDDTSGWGDVEIRVPYQTKYCPDCGARLKDDNDRKI
jgi:hypothetical protein